MFRWWNGSQPSNASHLVSMSITEVEWNQLESTIRVGDDQESAGTSGNPAVPVGSWLETHQRHHSVVYQHQNTLLPTVRPLNPTINNVM